MRTIEGSGLGTTTPVLSRPGKEPLFRMLMTGQRYCTDFVPMMPGGNFRASVGLDTCDDDGSGLRCKLSTPVSALGGLGAMGNLGSVTWSNVACSSYDHALQNLEILLVEAARVGVTGIVYDQARALLDDETSWAQWKHATPLLPDTCREETLKAENLYSALNDAVKAAGGTRGTDAPPPSENWSSPDKIADTIKVVAIASGITVSVVGIIYLVGPLIRGLAKAGARAVK